VLTVINSGSKIHAVLTNDAGELRAFSRDRDGEEWSDSANEALDENASFILDTVYEQYEADDEVEEDEGFDEDELDAAPEAEEEPEEDEEEEEEEEEEKPKPRSRSRSRAKS
jgi:hypothetical protein